MRIALGDHVVSQDGQKLGTVKHLVLDPATAHVKKVVVEKGFFLPDDIEVPLEAFQTVAANEVQNKRQNEVQTAAEDVVHLNLSAEQVSTLPRFDADLYAPLPPEQIPFFPGYPLGGILWPAGYAAQPFAPAGYPFMAGGFPLAAPTMEENLLPPKSPEVQEIRHHEDVSNAVISEGDMVLSRDGKEVGVVHSVSIDTETGKPTVLVVRKGFLFTEDTTLLADTIASVDDGVVTLTLDRLQIVR